MSSDWMLAIVLTIVTKLLSILQQLSVVVIGLEMKIGMTQLQLRAYDLAMMEVAVVSVIYREYLYQLEVGLVGLITPATVKVQVDPRTKLSKNGILILIPDTEHVLKQFFKVFPKRFRVQVGVTNLNTSQ